MGVLFYVVLVVAVVLSLCLMALVHAGYFYDLRIRTSIPLSLPGRIAYKLYRGAYSNAGVGFRDIMSVAPQVKSFGIYYDDPNKVSHWPNPCPSPSLTPRCSGSGDVQALAPSPRFVPFT